MVVSQRQARSVDQLALELACSFFLHLEKMLGVHGALLGVLGSWENRQIRGEVTLEGFQPSV